MKWIKRFYYFGTAWLYVVVASALLGYMVSSCWDDRNNKLAMVLTALGWPIIYPFAFLFDWLDIETPWGSYHGVDPW